MNIWGGDFAQKLISYHLSDGTFTKSDLDFFITETEKHFKNFAVSQKEFADLPKEDQDILLAENIPLFVNFVLSNYIMADSGLDQIVWILGPRAFSHASSETNSRFKNKSPQALNKDMSMFVDIVQWTRFQDLACLIKKMNFRYEKHIYLNFQALNIISFWPLQFQLPKSNCIYLTLQSTQGECLYDERSQIKETSIQKWTESQLLPARLLQVFPSSSSCFWLSTIPWLGIPTVSLRSYAKISERNASGEYHYDRTYSKVKQGKQCFCLMFLHIWINIS